MTAPRAAILFAHRGASAHAPENTLEAFRLAIALGATGLESDVHLDADGVPVLVHDPEIVTPGGRVVIRRARTAELGRLGIPTLLDLYTACSPEWPLSLDVNDAQAEETVLATIALACSLGSFVPSRLFLCHGDEAVLRAVAAQDSGAVPVLSTDLTMLARDPGGIPGVLNRMRRTGIAVLNLHHEDWLSFGASDAIARVHDAGLRAFAWDTQRVEDAHAMLEAGADGIYANDPTVLVAAAG